MLKLNKINNKIIYIILFCIVFVNGLYSESAKSIKLEWSPIKGNKGYKLEVKKEDGSISSENIKTNFIELNLLPGKYDVRVSALNKFRKPSNWSDWKIITVKDIEEKQNISMNKEEPKEEEIKIISIPLWKKFIPGFVTFEYGKKWKIITYSILFVGGSYYTYKNKKEGDYLSGKLENDEGFLWAGSYYSPTQLGPLLYFNRNSDRDLYDSYQMNQRFGGYFLAGLYLFSLIDSFYFSNQEKKISFDFSFYHDKKKTGNQILFQLNYSF
ncbi:MAG: fibronectin type III domain-containing protein [Leptospiraceae bacterium]|nr:fibronectin type III domain-containing protein [Leptospiraceae bacterium]